MILNILAMSVTIFIFFVCFTKKCDDFVRLLRFSRGLTIFNTQCNEFINSLRFHAPYKVYCLTNVGYMFFQMHSKLYWTL